MIEPGAVFKLPPSLAAPPQRAFQENPPVRDHRWVLIVSARQDCDDTDCINVLAVLLSTRIDLQSVFDVVVVSPDGGVSQDCIAQTDIVITIDKREISGIHGNRYQGTVMMDTLGKIRAFLRRRQGF